MPPPQRQRLSPALLGTLALSDVLHLAGEVLRPLGTSPSATKADPGHTVDTPQRFDPYDGPELGGPVWMPTRIYDRWQEIATQPYPGAPDATWASMMGQPALTFWTNELAPFGAGLDPATQALGMATRFDRGMILVRNSGTICVLPTPSFDSYWVMSGDEFDAVHNGDGWSDRIGMPQGDFVPVAAGSTVLTQAFSVPGADEGVDMYWHPGLGSAYGIPGLLPRHSPLRERWLAEGGGGGHLGWPLWPEVSLVGGNGGAALEFEHWVGFDNGGISWHPQFGAHVLNSPMAAAQRNLLTENYADDDLAQRLLMRITSDVRASSRGGWVYDVDGGRVAMAAGSTAAHLVRGAIWERYLALAAEAGLLGYPLTSEMPGPGAGRYSRFDHGSISWDGTTAYESHGPIYDYWAAQGYENSRYGYPWTDITDLGGGIQQQIFRHGTLRYTPGMGVQEYVVSVHDPVGPGPGDTYPHANEIRLWNCWDPAFPIHVWLTDLTAGTDPDDQGETAPQWTESKDPAADPPRCGPGVSEPGVSHLLEDGHLFNVRTVMPNNCGGENDPDNMACVVWDLYVRGDSSAGVRDLSP